MPFLTPEVTEDPEGRKSPNLTSEMPCLTLAVQSSDNTLLNPNKVKKSTLPLNKIGKTRACSGAPLPDWCPNPFREDLTQSHGSDPDMKTKLLEKQDRNGDRSASLNRISQQLKASTGILGCRSVKDFPLPSESPSESPSTSYGPNPLDKPSSPLDGTDFTSAALTNLFEETSTIMKSISYQNPEASELVPYAVWAEPRCQQVQCPDPLDFPEKSLTFADLEVGVVHHSNAELHGSSEGPESSDSSSSESADENSMSESEYGDSGFEPGEIRIVSTDTKLCTEF